MNLSRIKTIFPHMYMWDNLRLLGKVGIMSFKWNDGCMPFTYLSKNG